MHFCLIDRVLDLTPTTIVTLKHVSAAEEYLQDHFPTFPVLPGVMMLEAMVQAARRLAEEGQVDPEPLVLGQVRALKYGAFVKPGASLRVAVTLHKRLESGELDFKGEVGLVEAGAAVQELLPTACSGRFNLRPVRVAALRTG